MKILVVTSEFPSSWRPHRASFNRQHLNALADHHELEVVCPVSWRERGMGRGSLPDAPDTVDSRIRVTYCRYWYPPGFARGTYDWWMWVSIRLWLKRVAQRFRPDLVLGIWAFPDGAVALRLARQLEVPAVVQCIGSDVNLLESYPRRKKKTLAVLAGADGVLTVSKALRERLIDFGIADEQIEVVYRGVDAAAFAPVDQRAAREGLGLPPDRKLMLYVGNLLPVKNPELLLRAFAAAEFTGPVDLHVLGDGPLRPALDALAGLLPADRSVIFHGVVPHADLPGWMSAADLLVLPSRAEGVPNVLLEARANGCPYVATRVGGIPEISAHSGAMLVGSDSPVEMSAALEVAVNQSALPRESQPWYSWAEAGESLAGALEEAANNGHKHRP